VRFLLDVGDTVRQYRIDSLLSQEELAALCVVHRSYITEVENGKRNISLLTLQKIALALDIEPWKLLSTAPAKE
jgi:transcriptional regulator with XRE-family HTH domain